MSPPSAPELETVLEAFILDAAEQGALARYLLDYPQYRGPLLELAHEMRRELADADPELDARARAAIEAGWARLDSAWPEAARNLFAGRTPAEYARVSAELGIPRQLIAAIREGRVLLRTVPGGFLRRFAAALGGTVDELAASIGAPLALARSYKSEERPATRRAVSFEQALIDARVPEQRRVELLAETE